jgi:hypothetical protein
LAAGGLGQHLGQAGGVEGVGGGNAIHGEARPVAVAVVLELGGGRSLGYGNELVGAS